MLAHQQWQRLLDSLREEDPSTLSEDVVEVTGASDFTKPWWADMAVDHSQVLRQPEAMTL